MHMVPFLTNHNSFTNICTMLDTVVEVEFMYVTFRNYSSELFFYHKTRFHVVEGFFILEFICVCYEFMQLIVNIFICKK